MVQPQAPVVQVGTPEMVDKAFATGYSLQHAYSATGAKGPMSDIAVMGGQALKIGGEAIAAISSVFSFGDKNGDGIPDSQQNMERDTRIAAAPPPPSFHSMPSPGSGMA